MWTEHHRARGPHEHNDPPGDQSREALQVKLSRPTMGTDTCGRNMSNDTLWAVHNSIVGTPDTSMQQFTELSEHLHPGSRHLYGHAGPMPHRDVRRSMAWFSRAGVPALHASALPPYASATAPFPGAPARTRQGCAGGQPRRHGGERWHLRGETRWLTPTIIPMS